MVTFIDTGLIKVMLPLFSFLFILVIVFALLQKTKIFGDAKGINWMISLSVAVMMLFAGKTLDIISFVLPWILLIAIFLTFVFVIFLHLGVKSEDMYKEIWPKFGGPSVIVIISVLLLVIAISNVFPGVFSPFEEGGEKTVGREIIKTVFHPRILGALLILIIAGFAVARISEDIKNG